MLRLLTLVEKPLDRAPHQRFRLEQWAPLLADQHQIRLEFAPFESPALADLMDAPGKRVQKLLRAMAATARRWLQRNISLAYDGVVIQRSAAILGGAWMERHLMRLGIPYIFDFDDAIWEPPPGLTRYLWRNHARVPESIRLARAVTPGNDYLAAYARLHNADVTVVPTSIDLAQYRLQPQRRAAGPVRIVWIGSAATLPYLHTVVPALEQLGRRLPVTVRVVCNAAPPAWAIPVEFITWSPEVEVDTLAGSDIGIMPVPDTPFARGKCGLKALQYMAVGRAAVVSPVGVNRDIVRHGENGLWATTTQEWLDALERLVTDAALRERLAVAGRRTVEGEFSAAAAAARFAGVARRALSPSPGLAT